jgi:hypothetical protein
MITLKNFNLSRLLSQQVAPVCLGRELQGSNVFLSIFGCVRNAGHARPELLFNDDGRSIINEIKQLDDVGVAHPNTPTTRRTANFMLVFCAMDINESVACICIVLVQTLQPKRPVGVFMLPSSVPMPNREVDTG